MANEDRVEPTVRPNRRDDAQTDPREARAPGWRGDRARADVAAEASGRTHAPPRGPAGAPTPPLPPRARRTLVGLRIALVGLAVVAGVMIILSRFAGLAERKTEQHASTDILQTASADPFAARRASIFDRNGVALASSVLTYELYYNRTVASADHERLEAATAFQELLPTRTRADIVDRALDDDAKNFLVARPLTPLEAQRVHNLGVPGVSLRERWDRVYLGDHYTSHVIGWIGVDGAGGAGLELGFDDRLRPSLDGGQGRALRLTLDLRAQIAVRDALADAMAESEANFAAAVVLEVQTGAVVAMVSLPDFEPRRRPNWPSNAAEHLRSPLFNHAVVGRYEPGSSMKIVTWALALETGAATIDQAYPAPQPLRVGAHTITDFDEYGPMTFAEAFAKSSNIISATLALEIGPLRQRDLFGRLGLHEPSPVELPEARGRAPIWDEPWSTATTAATSYGHGVQMSPIHLATVAATLVNGGRRVRPTLLAPDPEAEMTLRVLPEQVVAEAVSEDVRALLRLAVTDGTGGNADVDGLEVGGKTGTANKYGSEEVTATFVAAFPMSDPAYVVVVMLDEPEVDTPWGGRARTAGHTAAPVVGRIVREIAPILGVAPTALSSL